MKIEPGSFQGLAPVEEDLFRDVLKGVGGYGIEIGCCDGYSTKCILEVSNLDLTSLDPLIPDSMESTLVGSEERLRKNMEPFGRRWSFLNMKSPPNNFFCVPLDFVFIDGDHSYEGALADFCYWTPKIKKGGILAMHDCRMNRGGAPFHKGPSQVADERVFSKPEEWQILGEAFSLMMARKLPVSP
jgi:hypothetical protein